MSDIHHSGRTKALYEALRAHFGRGPIEINPHRIRWRQAPALIALRRPPDAQNEAACD